MNPTVFLQTDLTESFCGESFCEFYKNLEQSQSKPVRSASKRSADVSAFVQVTIFDVIKDILYAAFDKVRQPWLTFSKKVMDANSNFLPKFKEDKAVKSEYWSLYGAMNSLYLEFTDFRDSFFFS